jgi:hypothetical protein
MRKKLQKLVNYYGYSCPEKFCANKGFFWNDRKIIFIQKDVNQGQVALIAADELSILLGGCPRTTKLASFKKLNICKSIS